MPEPHTVQIAGSILAGDLLNLGDAIRVCEQAGADLLQLDVCDGHFVPTISFGEEVVRRTCQVSRLPVEVHLMVSRPEDWLSRMAGFGQFRMIFHLEASRRSMGLVQAIQKAGMAPGIAINPESPASALQPLVPYIDNVCIMGIAPGFAGQTLLDVTFTKVAEVRSLIDRAGANATITVDGGVKEENARRLVEAGADVLVLSSGIFGHPQPADSLSAVRAEIEKARRQPG